MKKGLILSTLACLIVTVSHAQLRFPQPSPYAELTQAVGVTTLKVSYSRPGVKDREIFGGLVPYGEKWRTGANSTTKFTTSTDIMIGGKELKAGTYGLISIPGEKSWSIIFSSDSTVYAPDHKDENTVLVYTTQPIKMDEKIESFIIMFDELKNESANMYLGWDKTMIQIPIKVNTDAQVMASIDANMSSVDKSTPEGQNMLYRAATYYLENDKDIEKAYSWIVKATDNSETPKFWMLYRRALIEEKMGKKTDAKKNAMQSKELAAKEGYENYVKMNDELISRL